VYGLTPLLGAVQRVPTGQLLLSILIMLTQQFRKTSGRGFPDTILSLWNAVDIIVFISTCLETV